jgi:predicted dehydrogenase
MERQDRRLRLGIVGAGRLGTFHAQKAADHPLVRLCAVSDPSKANRDKLGETYGIPAFAEHRAMLEMVDAVVVAAPSRWHQPIGCEFLEHGIHVLMEKPLARTASEGRRLVETARRHGAVLQVGHVEQFNPAWSSASANRVLQQPRYFEAIRSSGFTFRSTDIGVVHDLMIHDLDLILSQVDAPLVRVEAIGHSLLGGHEDVANAQLFFANGTLANLSASRVSREPSRRMQVWSHDGFATIDFAARNCRFVEPSPVLQEGALVAEDLTPAEVSEILPTFMDSHFQVEETTHDSVDALALEMEDFVQSIASGDPPRVPGTQALEALSVAQMVIESIEKNRQRQISGVSLSAVVPEEMEQEIPAAIPLPKPKRQAG